MNDENVIYIHWGPTEIAQLIQKVRSTDRFLYDDACPIESILRGVLYLLHKIHGPTFSLSMQELIEFIGMKNLCVLASETHPTLRGEDKTFIKVLLESIPEFDPKASPGRQNPIFNRVISNVHGLIISCSTQRITPRLEQFSEVDRRDEP